jgi:hypothetical protein
MTALSSMALISQLSEFQGMSRSSSNVKFQPSITCLTRRWIPANSVSNSKVSRSGYITIQKVLFDSSRLLFEISEHCEVSTTLEQLIRIRNNVRI